MSTSKRKKGITAWLVTWEHSGDHAKPNQEIEAIYNPHWSGSRVKELVELTYVSKCYTVAEQIDIAKTRKNNPYPASVTDQGHIVCGDNPWLHARIVDNLLAWVDPENKTQVTWDERPKPDLTI